METREQLNNEIITYKINFTTASATTVPASIWDGVELSHAIPIGIVLSCMILATAIGNILVVTAVIRDKKLHSLSNRLVASLAITDLLVSLLVLPLAASSLIVRKWPFGPVLCDFFITMDVLLCTNSILHLVAIAVDRYWMVTDISYGKGNKKYRYFFPVMVLASWILSAAVCVPPFFGFGKNSAEVQIDREACLISQNKGYTIYSTTTAFYLPSAVIIIIYIKIFFEIRARVHKTRFRKATTAPVMTTTTGVTEQDFESKPPYESSPLTGKQDKTSYTNSSSPEEQEAATPELLTETSSSSNTCQEVMSVESEVKFTEKKSTLGFFKHQKIQTFLRGVSARSSKADRAFKRPSMVARKKKAQKRERKALRTLLIITGIFISCWLPFFIFALAMPFCGEWCHINFPPFVGDIVTWLGYSNSMLNPIIYTIFSPDFRTAFKKILTC